MAAISCFIFQVRLTRENLQIFKRLLTKSVTQVVMFSHAMSSHSNHTTLMTESNYGRYKRVVSNGMYLYQSFMKSYQLVYNLLNRLRGIRA
jgi:hypothetical protein